MYNLFETFHSVTGASRGYAFVEFETEREMRRAYKVQLLVLTTLHRMWNLFV